MPTPTELKTFLSDPLGEADILAAWEAGNNKQIVALLAQDSDTYVVEPVLSKNDFMLAIAPAFLVKSSLSEALQNKWNDVLMLVSNTVESVRLSHPTVVLLLDDMATDGLLSQAQRDAVGARLGTRAEKQFGTGVTISLQDVRASRKA